MTHTNSNGTHDGTQRVPVNEAAGILGISTEAARQRIKRGSLATERDADGNVLVLLKDVGTHTNGDSTRTTGDGTHDGTVDLSGLLESKDETIMLLRQQIEAEREANRENRRLLAAALERIPAIEPPETRDDPETGTEGESSTETPDEDAGRERASWWRRFFGIE